MSKNTINLNLDKLRQAVPLAHTSKFNFGTSEITQTEKDTLIKNESIFIKKFKECSAAKYEMCRALYEINLVLKESHTFVDWYKSIGLTKDKVYEWLNRYKLYLVFTGDKEKLEWVTSLSELAVTYLSRKYVEHEDLYEVFEKGLKKAVDIEVFLEDKKYRRDVQDNNKLGFINNDSPNNSFPSQLDALPITETKNIASDINNVAEAEIVETPLTKEMVIDSEINTSFEKIEKIVKHSNDIEEILKIKKIIALKKQKLSEFEKEITERETKIINKNQMKLFNDSQENNLKLGQVIKVMFSDNEVKELIVCKRTLEDSCLGKCDLYSLYSKYNICCHDLLGERRCNLGGNDKKICFKYKNK